MLWVVFNQNGQLINSYDTGNLAFAGTNEFEIFAVFKNIEIGGLNNYSGGSIKLYKPDREHTSYLPLAMHPESKEFDGTTNSDLQNGVSYSGLYFNFAEYPDNPLLDTTGLWRAVITLFNIANTSVRNVVGSVTFNVGNGIESLDGHSIELDDLINDLLALCETKLDKDSKNYLKVVDDIENIDFSDNETFKVDDIVLNRANKGIYKLDENKEPVLTGIKVSVLELANIEDLVLLNGHKALDDYSGLVIYNGDATEQVSDLFDISHGQWFIYKGPDNANFLTFIYKNTPTTYNCIAYDLSDSSKYQNRTVLSANTNFVSVLVVANKTEFQHKLTAGTGIAIVNDVISCTLNGFSTEVVAQLPAIGESGVFYLVPLQQTEAGNVYAEYIWIASSSTYEKLGDITTNIDMSQFVRNISLSDYNNLNALISDIGLNTFFTTSISGAPYLACVFEEDDNYRIMFNNGFELRISQLLTGASSLNSLTLDLLASPANTHAVLNGTIFSNTSVLELSNACLTYDGEYYFKTSDDSTYYYFATAISKSGTDIVKKVIKVNKSTGYTTVETPTKLLEFDSQPTENSNNAVTSGGLFTVMSRLIAIAEGKCKSFVVSCDITLEQLKDAVVNDQISVYDAQGHDISSSIADESHMVFTDGLLNPLLNSDSNSINTLAIFLLNATFLHGGIVLDTIYNLGFKTGDLLLVVETQVPDRWYSESENSLFKLETTKIDLNNLYAKNAHLIPSATNTYDLGSSTYTFHNLYLGGKVDFGNNATITKDSSNRINLNMNNNPIIKVGGYGGQTYIASSFTPDSSSLDINLGRDTVRWNNLYLKGVISDGTKSVSVADITAHSTIAPNYDVTATYAVGDKVFYNDVLYTCTTAITTAEAFDSSKWTAISVSGGFVDLDKAQVISGAKTFTSGIGFDYENATGLWSIKQDGANQLSIYQDTAQTFCFQGGQFFSLTNADLGNGNRKWKDLYLSGDIYLDSGKRILCTGVEQIRFYNSGVFFAQDICAPANNTTKNLGRSGYEWNDLYLKGAIKGIATISQADYDALVSAGTVDADTLYFITEN